MDIYEIRKANLLRLMSGRTKAACAEKWGTSGSTLSQITSQNPVRKLGDVLARKIEAAEGLENGWMDVSPEERERIKLTRSMGLTPVGLVSSAIRKGVREQKAQYESDATLVTTEIVEGDEPLRPDEVWLPVYREVEFAAGDGAQNGIEFTEHRERFTLPRLARAGVQPENAALAVVRGDSNDPVICDGATIAIDRGTQHIVDGKFYALDHAGMLRVKKLYRLPRDCMRVVSENETEYPEERYHMASEDAPKILGRVFWWENFD